MKDQQFLIIGLVVALGVGYLIGVFHGSKTEIFQTPLPANYDPARAICDDALKRAQAQTDTCFKNWMSAEQRDRATSPEKKITH